MILFKQYALRVNELEHKTSDLHLHLSHLADALIQSDLHIKIDLFVTFQSTTKLRMSNTLVLALLGQ
jgi:hypothetical protein